MYAVTGLVIDAGTLSQVVENWACTSAWVPVDRIIALLGGVDGVGGCL